MKIIDESTEKTLGDSLSYLFRNTKILDDKEVVINSNSGNTQTIFLNSIEKIVLGNETVLFYGENGVNDFLNLNNVLSVSIVGDL